MNDMNTLVLRVGVSMEKWEFPHVRDALGVRSYYIFLKCKLNNDNVNVDFGNIWYQLIGLGYTSLKYLQNCKPRLLDSIASAHQKFCTHL